MQPTSAATLAPTGNDDQEVKQGLDPLAEAGKLDALLTQFPISFRSWPS